MIMIETKFWIQKNVYFSTIELHSEKMQRKTIQIWIIKVSVPYRWRFRIVECLLTKSSKSLNFTPSTSRYSSWLNKNQLIEKKPDEVSNISNDLTDFKWIGVILGRPIIQFSVIRQRMSSRCNVGKSKFYTCKTSYYSEFFFRRCCRQWFVYFCRKKPTNNATGRMVKCEGMSIHGKHLPTGMSDEIWNWVFSFVCKTTSTEMMLCYAFQTKRCFNAHSLNPLKTELYTTQFHIWKSYFDDFFMNVQIVRSSWLDSFF